MKIHELKLDTKYFNDVKSGNKKFEIRKNDRDFEVGDILVLRKISWLEKFLVPIHFAIGVMIGKRQTYLDNNGNPSDKSKADTIKAKVTCVLSPLEVNEGVDFMNFKPEVSLFEDEALPFVKAGWRNDWNYEYFLKVLRDYFHTDRLPDYYVVLGIVVSK